MSCNNCYNGCTEITSDKCVKYTGIDIPELNINNGDSLFVVEQAIFNFLTPMLTGTGIKPIINPEQICDLIFSKLPVCTECTGFTLNELLSAIIEAVCELETQVNTVTNDVNEINASYTLECLTGVESTAGAHAILQAVINKLCSLDSEVGALAIDLSTNYVKKSEINTYIQAYIDSTNSSALISNKMVPYCPIPYIGSLSNFDITGAGIGNWTKVYLCNGLNGTIDARGRTFVGATTMGSNPFPAATDPAISGNPTYTLGSTQGANQVSLTNANQLPGHVHGATSVVTDPGHSHFIATTATQTSKPVLSTTNYLATINNQGNDGNYILGGVDGAPNVGLSGTKTTGITVATTVDSTGAGLPHSNIQPSIATYFIVYIP